MGSKKISGMFLLCILLFGLEACKPSDKGCTDPNANNMDAEAIENDGSCTYDDVWINPARSMPLGEELVESSGLIFWNGKLWSHNDNTDTRLYALDTATGTLVEEILLEGVENINWEEIDQDDDYIYVGDFGNNASGNRDDLRILRIQKNSLISGSPSIDTIWFSYSNQQDLNPVNFNSTEFDCEAFVVSSERIYLFTKQWTTGYTTAYSLSKEPGSHVAQKLNSLNVNGLISGAVYLEAEQLLVLSGYTGILQAFLYVFYDFPAEDFFAGNKRQINLSLPFLQVEGITTVDGLSYYLSNESYVKAPVNTPQQLHLVNLHSYLKDFLDGGS